MTVSLWGDKGPEFITELAKSKDIPVFVVITGLLAKTYFGTAQTFYALNII